MCEKMRRDSVGRYVGYGMAHCSHEVHDEQAAEGQGGERPAEEVHVRPWRSPTLLGRHVVSDSVEGMRFYGDVV